MAAISSLQIGGVTYDIYAKSAEQAPGSSHELSSHSHFSTYFNGTSANSALTSKSALSAGSAAKAASATSALTAGSADKVKLTSLDNASNYQVILGATGTQNLYYDSDLKIQYNTSSNTFYSPNISATNISSNTISAGKLTGTQFVLVSASATEANVTAANAAGVNALNNPKIGFWNSAANQKGYIIWSDYNNSNLWVNADSAFYGAALSDGFVVTSDQLNSILVSKNLSATNFKAAKMSATNMSATNIVGNLTGSATSALTSKSALSAGSATTAANAGAAKHLNATGKYQLWESSSWSANSGRPYALLADKTINTNVNWGAGWLFKIESRNNYAIFKINMGGTKSACSTSSISVIESCGMTSATCEKAIYCTLSWVSGGTSTARIYTDWSHLGSTWSIVRIRQLDNQNGDVQCYNDWDAWNLYNKSNNDACTALVATPVGTHIPNVYNVGNFFGNFIGTASNASNLGGTAAANFIQSGNTNAPITAASAKNAPHANNYSVIKVGTSAVSPTTTADTLTFSALTNNIAVTSAGVKTIGISAKDYPSYTTANFISASHLSNIQTASGYADDWNTNKTGLTNSAKSGWSAWSAVTHNSGSWTADTKVSQTVTSDNVFYPILTKDSNGTTTVTAGTRFAATVTINPSTKMVRADKFGITTSATMEYNTATNSVDFIFN